VIILGVHDGHNSNAAIFVNGSLVAAIAEERLSRQKNAYGFPEKAIAECLRMAGIAGRDLDRVALSTLRLPPMYFLTQRNAEHSIEDYWKEQRDYWYPRLYEGKKPSYTELFRDRIDLEKFPYDQTLIRDESDVDGMREARVRHLSHHLGIPTGRISVYDHHTCHAHFGYFAAPYRDRPVLVLTADGSGDGTNATVSIVKPGSPWQEISRSSNCNIGRMYRYATLLLGMRPAEHEFKVMGLAAYVDGRHADKAYQVYADTLQVEGLGFSYRHEPKDHFFHFKERLEGQRFDSIAYAIQRRTEELLVEWVGNAVRQTGIGDVVFTGGVAQNIKANQLIWALDGVKTLHVAPGSGDESLAIGAICRLMIEESGSTPDSLSVMPHAYLGMHYDDAAIDTSIARANSGYSVRPVSDRDVASLLANGAVIARFASDGMEFGARALGNRSILADPRRADVVQFINRAIKMRDFWMPFAPSILAERMNDYVVNPKGIDASYMTVAFDSTNLGREHLAAGLHAFDRTARPQAVRREANSGYHALISAFEEQTGVGALLNTSFNIHGEPIVATPDDALSTFRRCELPHLLMGSRLISKSSAA